VTIFDYLVLFVLVSSVIISTLRGLVKEILSLLGWIVAFVVANTYSAELALLLPNLLPDVLSGEAARLIAAFVLLFLGVRILMGLLSLAIGALITASGLTLADRGLGGLFGLARGIVIVLAAVILCGMTSIPQTDFWKNALLSPMAETGARTVKPFLPAALAQHVKF
jgi:membrane protein required for colicin V production